MEPEEFEKLAEISFQIIANVGTAKAMYIQAVQKAKVGDFEGATKDIKDGDEVFVNGHHAHADLVAKEANGEAVIPILLLVHAEDQLMAAETVKILCQEVIELYKKLAEGDK
jgi:PTS system cellobiose-specific IIA component